MFVKESKENFCKRKSRRALAEVLYETPLLSALQENCIGKEKRIDDNIV